MRLGGLTTVALFALEGGAGVLAQGGHPGEDWVATWATPSWRAHDRRRGTRRGLAWQEISS